MTTVNHKPPIKRSINELLDNELLSATHSDVSLMEEALREARADFEEIAGLGDVRSDEAPEIATRRLKTWGKTP